MSSEFKSGLLISDFNIENLAAYLKNDAVEPLLNISVAPFGQAIPVLLDHNLTCWSSDLDFAVVWTRPESVCETFGDRLSRTEIEFSRLEDEVDAYCAALLGARGRAKILFVPTWVVPTYHQGLGLLDLSAEAGVTRALMRMNLRLLQNLDKEPNIFVLNTQKWIELVGEKSFSPRLWYTGKIAFGNDVFKAAAKDIKAALRGIGGRSRKVIVLDLDDTLWGGIVGDLGWEQIKLGGHDPIGEALSDFQKELKALTKRGIVLAIASKNEESTALTAIDLHPEMVLRRDDFAAWRINWKDKAANIQELAAELNLGLDAFVFIDDNPVERARVREIYPEILVPEWPSDHRLYPQALLSLDCFDKPQVTDEDQQRPRMYVTERQRAEIKNRAGSLDEWLSTLCITVNMESLNPTNLARAAQLLNKTNQLNLSTRRMSESELWSWAEGSHRKFWIFRVTDKFGDSGLTGLLSLEYQDSTARLEDFVLSCRVMGRKVEETMLHVAALWAQEAGLKELVATYKPTPKNKPCLDFLQKAGFRSSLDHHFSWDLAAAYPKPVYLTLVDQDKPSSVASQFSTSTKA